MIALPACTTCMSGIHKGQKRCRIVWKWSQGVLQVSTEFFKLNPDPGQE